MKEHLQGMSLPELEQIISAKGGKSYRAGQLLQALVLDKAVADITTLPQSLKQALAEEYSFNAAEIIKALSSKDNSVKYLYKLNDSNIIEGVFICQSYGNTLCISTQVGCKMHCAFCASGLDGFVRNLTAGELAAQVYSANVHKGGDRQKRAVSNVVLMGAGEPLDNYDNVIKFLRLISDKNGLNISLRNITLSTCGLVPQIKRLAGEGLPITLAISLHHAKDDRRAALMPINNKYSIGEIMAAAEYYYKKSGRRVSLEYALIEGKNTDIADAKALAELVKGKDYHINLIALNEFKEGKMHAPSAANIKRFMAELAKSGANYTLRHSAGGDIDAACGQLRRSYLEGESH